MANDPAKDAPETSRGYLAPYEHAARVFGPSFEATLWASKEKQVTRFEVLAQMIECTDRVIVDAGCGMGDFAAYLHERDMRYRSYIGVEGVEQIAAAAAQRALPRADVIHADFAADKRFFATLSEKHPYDIAVFSGSLNTFDARSARSLVRRAWKRARVGVAFNFLSTCHGRPPGESTGPAQRFDPVPMLAWALRRTPNVLFRQDYFHGHDATIVMLRTAVPDVARTAP